MEILTNILLGIVLLPFFLLDAIEHTNKKLEKEFNKARTERTYVKDKKED